MKISHVEGVWCSHQEWDVEVGRSSIQNQTNRLQVGIQEKVQIRWLT
jgi:hypothetical protein